MKIFLSSAICLWVLLIGYSCGKNQPAVNESATATTSVEAPAKPASEPAADDVRNDMMNRVTYDLAFYELHGPVHVLKEEYHTITFDKDGKMISLDGYDPFTSDVYGEDYEHSVIRFHRDSKGRISEQEAWEFLERYTWNGMKMVSSRWDSEGMWGVNTYIYNADGHLTTIKATESEIDSQPSTSTYKITYLSYDDYGNWTARKSNGNVEKRTITYYPVP